jgi:cytochrome bd-type quinol oxidase subunit 2
MLVKLAFATLLILTCCYAAWRGGWSGKVGALIFLVASIATIPATAVNPKWTSHMAYIWVIDLGCLAALAVLALSSRRYWPIWATGFQIASITTHIAVLIYPDGPPRVYMALETVWSIPILLVMLIGTRLDHQSGAFRISPSKMRSGDHDG